MKCVKGVYLYHFENYWNNLWSCVKSPSTRKLQAKMQQIHQK